MKLPFLRRLSAAKRRALVAAASYVLLSMLWIFASDRLLLLYTEDPARLAAIQTYKGWIFITLTGVFIYALLRSSAPAKGGPRDEARAERLSFKVPLAVFILVALTTGLLGYVDYLQQRRVIEKERRDELVAIADLKVGQLGGWLAERRADAEAITRNPFFVAEAKRWLQRGAPADRLGGQMLQGLQALQKAYVYHAVILLDEQASVRLAVSGGKQTVGAVERELARRAMQGKQVVVSDLHVEPGGSTIEIDILAPLLVDEGGATRAVGAVYFSVDARQYLFPLIQSWPTPSQSAETLLFRRDGSDVLYLNELRHRKNTALALRLPLNSPDLPAARALRGERGVLAGTDYRGTRVLAAVRPVPLTSWSLVAKVDSVEIFSEVSERAQLDAILTLALILAAALTLAFWWRQQQARFLLRQYRDEIQRRALEASNKELEAFSYSISHDLRAPLRAIQGFAGIVAQRHRGSLNEEGQHYLDNIVAASGHMERMIEDLLRYARLGRHGLERPARPLRLVLAEVATEFQERARQAGAVLTFPDSVPDVDVNDTLLEQILSNLIANALTYHRPGVPPRVAVACAPENGSLLISVADNGIGVAPEHREIVFNMFQRLHGEGEYLGTGIGLALVKKAAELLGGSVWLESTPGCGSTFFVRIPRRSAS